MSFMFGEKELLDLTVKELRVELGKYNLLKNGRKAELQRRLRAALEKMARETAREEASKKRIHLYRAGNKRPRPTPPFSLLPWPSCLGPLPWPQPPVQNSTVVPAPKALDQETQTNLEPAAVALPSGTSADPLAATCSNTIVPAPNRKLEQETQTDLEPAAVALPSGTSADPLATSCSNTLVPAPNRKLEQETQTDPALEPGSSREDAIMVVSSPPPPTTSGSAHGIESNFPPSHYLHDCRANLWVSGLDLSIQPEDLERVFSPFGQVIVARVLLASPSRVYAYVAMATASQAKRSLRLSGTILRGRKISVKVDYSTSSAEAIGVPPPTSTTGPSAGSLAQRHGVLVGQKGKPLAPQHSSTCEDAPTHSGSLKRMKEEEEEECPPSKIARKEKPVRTSSTEHVCVCQCVCHHHQ